MEAVLKKENIVDEAEVEKRKKVKKILEERIVQYRDLANAFEESIDTYNSLIAVVEENSKRFKKYSDVILQFTETRRSFRIQKRNTVKAVKRFEKILRNLDSTSLEEVLEALKI